MEQDERLRFSFGAAAAAYAEHRPDYARAAVRWALERAPGPRVLDLGAGTGKPTAVMAALCAADVIAVELDPAMLAELRRAVPDVRALPGRAEAIPLPEASVDAVLVGHALHWFDMAPDPPRSPDLPRKCGGSGGCACCGSESEAGGTSAPQDGAEGPHAPARGSAQASYACTARGSAVPRE
ncbi:MAG TPA: class I SAM-dependent methyltransferase, partial [Streptosporangiaceae bacterium]|nr:class I SAM-dependent methyltransferase [Streptosporangiaceae bacterium]